MFKRWLYAGSFLWVLAVLGLGCSGDEGVDFSGNVDPELNVTGNYEVKRTPLPSLTNFTITQTNNRVQAVDNEGVVYTGTTPGDIETIFVATGTGTVTTSITLQGSDAGGTTRTLILTTITYFVEDPFSDPSVTVDITTAVVIIGLAGTYTDTGGTNGAIELVSNTLQPDITF